MAILQMRSRLALEALHLYPVRALMMLIHEMYSGVIDKNEDDGGLDGTLVHVSDKGCVSLCPASVKNNYDGDMKGTSSADDTKCSGVAVVHVAQLPLHSANLQFNMNQLSGDIGTLCPASVKNNYDGDMKSTSSADDMKCSVVNVVQVSQLPPHFTNQYETTE